VRGGGAMPQIKFVDTPSFSVKKKISKSPMAFMHHHDAFEIFYIINGEREYFIEDEFFKLAEGDIAIVPSNLLHRTDGKSAARYLIYFTFDYLNKYMTTDMIDALSIHRPCVFRPDDVSREHMAFLFGALYNAYMKAEKEGSVESSPTLAIYLSQILMLLSTGDNRYTPQKYSDCRVEEIVKYINENYGGISSIDEIAERFYLSKYYLCHLFNKNLGVGLVSYLNTIKIRRACELLDVGHAKMSITEIATKCGFNSSSYFCKVFKEEKGMSPSEYRKQRSLRVK
jgi:AraC-like DNA-binding protein